MSKFVRSVVAAAALAFSATAAQSAVITTYYGDDDGFGIGATSGTLNPNISNAAGDAALTDIRLIGSGFSFPGFAPTGGFTPFSLTGPVTAAVLTIRLGAFDSGPRPVDGPNFLMLDGLTVPASFLGGFSSANTGNIETMSFNLAPSFFGIFADGMVSLNGTRISEDSGSGSFQVDFLRLDIETAQSAVPEPATWMMMILGFGAIGGAMRRRRNTAVRVTYA